MIEYWNETVNERVARGVALLNEQVPGWRERIDQDSFSLESCHMCVFGQLYGEYYLGESKFFDQFGRGRYEMAAAYGFTQGLNDPEFADQEDALWDELTEAWLTSIRAGLQ